MTTINVDFYLLATPSMVEGGKVICQKIEELYLQGKKVYINVDNLEIAKWLDDQLWTFRDISFIPHAIVGNEALKDAPIQIGCLALDEDFSKISADFPTIVEIVPNDENLKAISRKKYKFYQSQNCQLNTHKL